MSLNRNCLNNIDAVILAGGLGTRVSHILKDKPKVLAPVGGRPFLDILLERLAGFGARRVVLGLGHLAEAVNAHLKESSPEGMEVITATEPAPLGTAGAVRFLMNRIKSDPVLVMNGDSFVGADLCAFVASHAASGAEASLLCAEVDDTSRFGRIDIDPDGRVKSFAEKTGAPSPGIISAGVYLFNAAMLSRIRMSSGPSLERDIFQAMETRSLHAMTGRFPFIDIGAPESLDAASDVVLSCLNG
ncbi:MAG: hypothetical protein A3G18_05425 [Rhodospirillales bacterium RIFCSPLOWO2_12_FULL_58_28]|nr:MAG: hypothetical protein A3H92_05710 [Rhodospirillales bacterium RIFCSPLOWO2_02_FULL_58_16]OHC79439.1 MAG: hypothetical protein A3G18_05425 [Rhodospirillales bacterium RIFCSPLOWO2_12_FULL_58_28]